MNNLPKHIAFIMDGNGRWAIAKQRSRSYGHKKGAAAMKKIVDACFDRGIKIVSVFAFSTENWKRPQSETSHLMSILEDYLIKETERITKKGVRLNFMGDLSVFSDKLKHTIDQSKEKTKNNDGYIFNIGINYGARQEIVRAVNLINQSGLQNIDETVFSNFLYTNQQPDPDLIIRTGGELRLSNFMLFQAAYSEMFFSDTLWPDFTNAELDKILLDYSNRKRRFGNLEE